MITLIYKTEVNDDYVTIVGVVEDAQLIYPGSYMDPPEYGPGVCKASFYLDEGEVLPEDNDELIDYLNELDLDWDLVPDGEY
jgi:hypothetical protein